MRPTGALAPWPRWPESTRPAYGASGTVTRLIDHHTPADKQRHRIVDTYATHKHSAVQRWAARHNRFHFHFTPTSSSWLNMVERFFRDLTENQLPAAKLSKECILAYIEEHNPAASIPKRTGPGRLE